VPEERLFTKVSISKPRITVNHLHKICRSLFATSLLRMPFNYPDKTAKDSPGWGKYLQIKTRGKSHPDSVGDVAYTHVERYWME
jgi:hypothetical protein